MGPMFAGKTTALLEQVRAAEAAGLRVAVVTSALDNRYGVRQCISHAGESRSALAVSELTSLMQHTKGSQHWDIDSMQWDIDSIDVIAIDESQFFPDLADFVHYAVDVHRKKVIVAGLSGDYKRRSFGQIVSLVPQADSVEFLKARCNYCEMPASFTLRLVANEQQQLIGGAAAYQPVCREHYASLANVADEMSD